MGPILIQSHAWHGMFSGIQGRHTSTVDDSSDRKKNPSIEEPMSVCGALVMHFRWVLGLVDRGMDITHTHTKGRKPKTSPRVSRNTLFLVLLFERHLIFPFCRWCNEEPRIKWGDGEPIQDKESIRIAL